MGVAVANHSLGVKDIETCVCVMIRNCPDRDIIEAVKYEQQKHPCITTVIVLNN